MGLLNDLFGGDNSNTMYPIAAGLLSHNLGAGLLQAGQLMSPQAQLQRQALQQNVDKGGLELQLMREQVARTNAIRDALAREQAGNGAPSVAGAGAAPAAQGSSLSTPTISGIPMFSMGTSVAPQAAPQAQAPSPSTSGTQQDSIARNTSAHLVHQADIYSRYGDFENANKLYEQAAKFMPEVKEMGVLMQNGQPVNVITYKDGTQQITNLTPKPDVHWLDTGGSVVPVNQLTMSPMASPVNKTPSPDALLSDSRERSQFRQTLAKDYTVAGFNPDGTPASDLDITARAIANGQLPPPSGMALTNPRNQRILSRVMEINPNYDFTDVTAKRTAAAAFTTGQQGNAIRSFATAGEHLDQLGNLVDAMGNGNTPLVNKIANTFSQQTGSPAVTNFDAAKDIVSKEVMKAIVAGGGGVGEREELQKTMDNAKSPQQLKGVIQQYRSLMAAQYENLLAQRRAAGLPDSTLPKYNFGSVTPGTTPATGVGAPNFRWNPQTRKLEAVGN